MPYGWEQATGSSRSQLFDDGLQVNIALEIDRVFTRMALLDNRPVPMLRQAEQLVRRVAQSARKSPAKIDDQTAARMSQTLEWITGELHSVVDPVDTEPPSRMRALSHRASWLVQAATQAIGAKSRTTPVIWNMPLYWRKQHARICLRSPCNGGAAQSLH